MSFERNCSAACIIHKSQENWSFLAPAQVEVVDNFHPRNTTTSKQKRELAKRERNRYNWDISLPLNSNLFKFTCHSRSALSHLGPRSFFFLPTHSIYRAIVLLCSSHSTAIVSATTAVLWAVEKKKLRGEEKKKWKSVVCCMPRIFFLFLSPHHRPRLMSRVESLLHWNWARKRETLFYISSPRVSSFLIAQPMLLLVGSLSTTEEVEIFLFFFSHKQQQQHSKWDEERRQ